jgi:hypothetical protein
MILTDVNVLIYAHRADMSDHERYRGWLEDVIAGPTAYGVSDLVLSGFLRVVTNARIFKDPTPSEQAIEFVEAIRTPAHAMVISPGPRHWAIFIDLCRRTHARGKLIPDAYFAALAIESGSEWITTDRDYARFPGLQWRHPLE